MVNGKKKAKRQEGKRAGFLRFLPSRILLFFLLFTFCFLLLTGCDRPKTIILFNKNPITKENFLNNSTEFPMGTKIYYLFITEKRLDTNTIRIRVLKRDEKAGNQPVKLVYSNDFRMFKDQLYYYNDYIVINDAGNYCMLIYSTTALDKPLAVADFKVRSD